MSGKNVLKDLVGDVLPRIVIGSNGSLVKDAALASKTDGLLGTIHATGGAFRAKTSIAPSGLSMEHNLPMIIVPAQLTLTSLGCPLADLQQAFFVDFGTGTTIDNIYTVTQISHTLSPGKFETAWTFTYTNGYGKFFSAMKPTDFTAACRESQETPVPAIPPDPPKQPIKPKPSTPATEPKKS
jgi:hypothetical protein